MTAKVDVAMRTIHLSPSLPVHFVNRDFDSGTGHWSWDHEPGSVWHFTNKISRGTAQSAVGGACCHAA